MFPVPDGARRWQGDGEGDMVIVRTAVMLLAAEADGLRVRIAVMVARKLTVAVGDALRVGVGVLDSVDDGD
jgi:hypothetical protein